LSTYGEAANAPVSGCVANCKSEMRWGRYLLLSPRELERVDRFFARYGAASVFVARLLPIVRTFISLPAGVSRMPFLRFQVYTFAGSCPWCFALAYLGFRLGKAWNSNPAVQSFFHRLDWIGWLAAAFAWFLYRRWR